MLNWGGGLVSWISLTTGQLYTSFLVIIRILSSGEAATLHRSYQSVAIHYGKPNCTYLSRDIARGVANMADTGVAR